MKDSPAPKKSHKGAILQSINFISAGIGGMGAISFCQPIDYTKVNVQLLSEQGQKNIRVADIWKNGYNSKGGLSNFYRGLTPALLRQAIFCTLRMGMFYSAMDLVQSTKGRNLTLYEKAPVSMIAGGFASLVATPCDIATIRMQADVLQPEHLRRNYKGISDAFKKIVKEDKFLTLWRGAVPTICRAAMLNFSLLVPFEEAKEKLKKLVPEIKTRTFFSSAIASFVSTIVCLPFDNIKVKFQRMQRDPKTGQMPYKNIIDCTVKSVKREGFLKLWAGYWTFFMLIFPFGLISLNIADFVRISTKSLVEKSMK
jgi:solute carrier family 25 oxoglutarate transporter 11